jgi:predicted transcriptional regulator
MSKSLATTTIKQLVERDRLPTKQSMLVLEANWTVLEALDALAKRRVRSAPVVNDGVTLGIFDVRDLLSAMLEAFSTATKPEEVAWKEFEHDLSKLTIKGMLFVCFCVVLWAII